MIFLTIGTQLPFDRLVRAVDGWLGDHDEVECFGQVGAASYVPNHMSFERIMTAERTRQKMQQSDFIIAHAGMGTVISALQLGKPLLIMPRVCAFGEQRNDHQLATASAFRARPNVFVAMDETEVGPRLDELMIHCEFEGPVLGPHASPEFLEAIRDFIGGER